MYIIHIWVIMEHIIIVCLYLVAVLNEVSKIKGKISFKQNTLGNMSQGNSRNVESLGMRLLLLEDALIVILLLSSAHITPQFLLHCTFVLCAYIRTCTYL